MEISEQFLKKEYLKNNKTIKEIALETKKSTSFIFKKVKEFSIQTRSPQNHAWRNRISKTRIERKIASGKKNPMYGKISAMRGKKHSSESKLKISRSKQGVSRPDMIGKLNLNFGKPFTSYKGIYKNIRMRSSWEIEYAKFLDHHKIKWFYEIKTFDLGDTTYTPDFYIPKFKSFVEIKGRWIRDAKSKIQRAKKKYKIRVLVLMKKDLKQLGIKIK